MIITWDVTRECSLDCIHCLNATRRLSGRPDLSTKEALDLIKQFADYYVREIHFTGGEPFSRPDILRLADYATERGLAVSFTTNGLLINEGIAEKLVDLAVKRVILSIDGGTPETNDFIRGEGTFDRVIEATKVLMKEKKNSGAPMEIIWSCVLLKPNLGEMRQLLSLANTLEVQKLMLSPLELLGKAKINEKLLQPTVEEAFKACEDAAVLMPEKYIILSVPLPPKAISLLEARYRTTLESLRERKCNASTYSCYVTHDGLLYPCRYGPIILDDVMRKGGLKPSQVNIDLKVKSFSDIYNSDLFLEFMRRVFEPGIYHEMVPCNRCDYIKTTKGPCLPKCPFSDETEVKECLVAEEMLRKNESHNS